MLLSKALFLFSTVLSVLGHPTDSLAESKQIHERATIQLMGNRVAVVTGIVLNPKLRDCFGDNGIDAAKAWAGALYDQWFYSKIPGTLVNIAALTSDRTLKTGSFCFTVDAIFQFTGTRDAQKFATWVGTVVGYGKRDELHVESLAGSAPKVYIEGVDLPIGHYLFGPNATREETSPTVARDISKRGFGSCQNTCGFSFTNDQTSSCRTLAFDYHNGGQC